MPIQFYIKTFGCQMNELDSAKMAAMLVREGFTEVSDIRKAVLILFNTCTVREKSHHKAVSEVGRALKLKRRMPHLIVGVAGCVAQEEREGLFDIYPDLDLVIGPDQLHRIPELIKGIISRRESGISAASSATELVNDHEHYKFISLPSLSGPRVTSFVTVMKGCNNFCAFCIVPYVRGREVSRSPSDIVAEVASLSASGVKEVTLLGQNVNSYGRDSAEFGSFAGLLARIAGETGILRIRYTSPHPKDFSDALIEEHRTNPVLCEHIHLPVQAGSTKILKAMNRNYTKEQYINLAEKIKAANPEIAITTDIIAGFPGETDEDFRETIDLLGRIEFDGMFAFKYSERAGTKAAEKFRDDVPERVKLARLSEILALNEKIVLKKHEKYVGTVQEVLIEGESRRGMGQLTGRTRTNKIVNFEGDPGQTGSLKNVKIVGASPNSLKGSDGLSSRACQRQAWRSS